MREKLHKYVKVLRVELEDLAEDLKLMEELYGQREKRDEITDYVFLENVSLLQSEISGIESIIRSLEEIIVERYSSLDELVEEVDSHFRKRTKDSAYPEAVYSLVKRKLSKVARYIQSTDV